MGKGRKNFSRRHHKHRKKTRIRVKYRGRNFYLCNFIEVKEEGKNVFLFKPNRNGSMNYYVYNGVNKKWMKTFLKEMKRSGFKNCDVKDIFRKTLSQEKALRESIEKDRRA